MIHWSLGGDAEGEVLAYPSLAEMEAWLQALAAAHPGLIALQEAGWSVEGRPIWRVVVTDRNYGPEDKERVVLIAQEHGDERSATLAVLELIAWLTTPAAQPVLQRQVVVALPCANPDGWDPVCFTNRARVNLYLDHSLSGETTQPESRVVRETLDTWRPEVVVDLHGTWRGHAYRAVDSTGVSYATSQFDRPHARLLVEEIARAAEAQGFPQDRGEEDAERILPWLPDNEHHSFHSRRHVTPPVYAYHRYHSLGMTMEVVRPESGLIRLRRLLELGDAPWRTEAFPGYPTRTILWNAHAFLCAAGARASDCRESRIELWQYSRDWVFGIGVPQPVGYDTVLFSTSREDRAAWSGRTLADVLAGLDADARFDTAAMQRAGERLETTLCLVHEDRGEPQSPEPLASVRNGLGLRLRLPPRARPQLVLLDGHRVAPLRTPASGTASAPASGRPAIPRYRLWSTQNGWSMLQVDVPPCPPEALPAGNRQRHVVQVRYR